MLADLLLIRESYVISVALGKFLRLVKKQRRKTIQKRHLKALKSDELYQEALRNENPKAIKYRDELEQALKWNKKS